MHIYIHIYIYIYIYIMHTYLIFAYTFLIFTNISVFSHKRLQCVWIKHFTKSLHTQQKLKIN